MALSSLIHLLSKLGPAGTISLVRRKMEKRKGYREMLLDVPRSKEHHSRCLATLKPSPSFERNEASWAMYLRSEEGAIRIRADAMLRDENHFFTFEYQTKEIERPWEYDPIEKKYWPRRHYTERALHAADTPRDVKIVWEINRFKDLPALAQAAVLRSEKQYAEEVGRRLRSWSEQNPFAWTINWASALEISIRLLSWTTSLLLVREAGMDCSDDPSIARSIYEQARYLAADLSTDKIVPTNHLIGEAAGLFIVSTLWDFPGAKQSAETARDILEREIVSQTFRDGVSQEASGWYHQFVTHFFDLAERVAARSGQPMSESYRERLSKMKTYLSAITIPDSMGNQSSVVRYGDSDDGWALYFEGDQEAWKTHVFGPASAEPAFEHGFFPDAQHAAFFREDSFLFLRGGMFGMGGAGFSSHAHDDFLSPVIALDGIPVLVDPGTYRYNGDLHSRAKYRGETAHNGLRVGQGSRAVQRMNFGWKRVRPSAVLTGVEFREDFTATAGRYGEWRGIRRSIALLPEQLAVIHDEFDHGAEHRRRYVPAEWRFHLHPMWQHEKTMENGTYIFSNGRGKELVFLFKGIFDTCLIEVYDYSPLYLVEQKALLVRLTAAAPLGAYEVRLAVRPHAG